MERLLKAMGAVVMMALAGCQAPGAAPIAANVVAGADTAAPLRVLPAAAKRRLMDAGPGLSKLWGVQVRQSWWEYKYLTIGEHNVVRDRIKANGWTDARLVNMGEHKWGARVEVGWRYDGSIADGVGPLVHLDQGRFAYDVPAGRVLIVNRVEFPGRIRVNRFPLAIGGWERTSQLDEVDYVFGPGERVLLAFDSYMGAERGRLTEDGKEQPAALYGMLADPAIFGGTLPAGVVGRDPGGEAEATGPK